MLGVYVLLNLAILIAYGICNYKRQNHILIAEQLNRWYYITYIFYAVMFFIGYPTW